MITITWQDTLYSYDTIKVYLDSALAYNALFITDTLEFITEVVKKSHAAGKPFPPGQYVLKERVVEIDEQGNVTPLDL